MPTTVFLNGAFVEPGEARVSAFDAGLQHAVGLFETLAAGNAAGEAWGRRLPEHVDRLCASAQELALSNDLRRDALIDAVLLTVKRSGLPRARVRLTITAGDMSAAPRPAPGTTPPPPLADRDDPRPARDGLPRGDVRAGGSGRHRRRPRQPVQPHRGAQDAELLVEAA
ncbi:MAG: aminotransferase class IV [Phycisphaerales bacterium]|nr:aminotransferase class IV [Phycisphaerales bacterium]